VAASALPREWTSTSVSTLDLGSVQDEGCGLSRRILSEAEDEAHGGRRAWMETATTEGVKVRALCQPPSGLSGVLGTLETTGVCLSLHPCSPPWE
jgi:hypothetical protein